MNHSLTVIVLDMHTWPNIRHDITSPLRPLRPVSRVPQALPFLNLLINVSQWILQMRVVRLLLIKRCHAELLM